MTKNNKEKRLRISVFRTNTAIKAQVIDDEKGATLLSVSTSEIKDKATPVEKASKAGEMLAQRAKEAKITNVYFDRGCFQYHGRVKALAEGLRKGGLEF